MLEDRKIFSKAPLNLLVNPDAIKYQKPWQIDLVGLLTSFITLLEKLGPPDLRLCGSAALSSALIYRLKVETLFLFEKLRSEKKMSSLTEPPGFIAVPFRYELYTTNIDDLVYALQKIVEDILSEAKVEKPRPAVIEPEPTFETDQFLLRIREMLEPFRLRLMNLLRDKGEVLFSEYVSGMRLIEEARSFILLLFLATDGTISLEQVGDDIKILGSFQNVVG